MFALRAKEKLISIEKKDKEKKEKKILERKKELQKFHEGLLPGDPRIGAVKRPNTAAKRDAKYIGTFSVQQNEPTLGKIKQIVSQQVSRIDFRQPPSAMPVAILVSVEGVKVLSEDGKQLIMAHALKRILFTMVHDKHTAFILVARNPDSPPDLCHCHIFMAESQIEAGDINELVGKALKLAFANKSKRKDKKNKKESKPRESRTKPTHSDSSHSHGTQSVPICNHTTESVPAHFEHNHVDLKSVEVQQLKETIERLDQELLQLNIENFDLESYFNTYQSDKGSEQYLKALSTYEANRRVIAQKSVILERTHTQCHQLINEHSRNDHLAGNRNSNNVLVPPPLPKKGLRSRSPSPVHDQEIPPPLPPKPKPTSDSSPPLIRPPHCSHTSSDSSTSVPIKDQRIPRPYEKPISHNDTTRTLTPADAPIPPGYEVWEPDLAGATSSQGSSKGNDFVLRDAEWFQSGIPREIAEEILRSEGEGSFIVRSSQSNPGCYALSIKAPRGNIMNFLIEEDSKGVRFQGDDCHTFPNLVGLIVHHSVVPGILPCPLAVTKSNPLFAVDEEDNSSDEDPDYLTRSEVHKLFN